MDMVIEDELKEALRTHPCYNEAAHKDFARMHLPVAPRCNIQCNYCNRKYDCSNESRPGVTSEVLTPKQAVSKVRHVLSAVPAPKVIGIAGPGDPLANEETFRTLELVGKEFPELTLCLSTNGLALPENAERLYNLGVRFVTVTMNAVDPAIGGKVYSHVTWKGHRYTGAEGAFVLLENQLEGIRRCAELGMLVKVNVVMVPGVNADHIPELVKKAKAQGAYIVNILPLIPVEGTAFENMRAPTAKERKDMMDLCSLDAKMMRHCKQCRADAIGLLGEDRSAEFAGCGMKCDSQDSYIINISGEEKPRPCIAVATTNGKEVDAGFGNTERFDLYEKNGNIYKFIRTVSADSGYEVSGKSHRESLEARADLLSGCKAVVVSEIGSLPLKILEGWGMETYVLDGRVGDALNELQL